MRNWLQIVLGILAAVLGWSFTQFLIVDLSPIWEKTNFTFFLEFPYLVKFVVLTLFLALAMVISEIFLSYPTRFQAGLRVIKIPLLTAVGFGVVAGLLSTGIRLLLEISPVPPWVISLTDWLIIGVAVGLAEAASWYVRLLFRENPDLDRVKNRFIFSSVLGLIGSGIAFFVAQRFSNQEILGFMFLGGLLGFSLSLIPSPSSQPALRIGYGFEATLREQKRRARIKRPLKFTRGSNELTIKEGLSIELPLTGELLIGSDNSADIYVSDLPEKCAKITLKNRKASIEPLGDNGITIKNKQILIDSCDNPEEQGDEKLKHNQIITLYAQTPKEENSEVNEASSEKKQEIFTSSNKPKRKYVRFVFYDRFLDPEA